MRIPTVETCCCGCNLRLGSAIIGVIFFLVGLSQTISFSVKADEADTQNDGGDSKASYALSAVLSALMLVSTIFLLYGVHKERYGLLKPWLLGYSLLACVGVAVLFISALVAFGVGLPGDGLLFLLIALLDLVIYGYCLVVVYSYYLTLLGVSPGTV